MPFLYRPNTRLYYEIRGDGEPLLLLHGFSVNTHYWTDSGLSAQLAAKYRVILPDLRGHGRTEVYGRSGGFDVTTLGDDLAALIEALALDHFHLLGHSAGGMVAVHYAMRGDSRLSSLLLVSTCPATLFGPGEPRLRRQALQLFAELYDRYDWDQIFAHLRHTPGPLLYRLKQLPEQDRLWGMLEAISRRNNPRQLAAFVRDFFADPDPRLDALRQIACPTLVLVGEHDKLFLQPSDLLTDTIPQARQVRLAEVGHMTALEAPHATAQAILSFLDSLPPPATSQLPPQ